MGWGGNRRGRIQKLYRGRVPIFPGLGVVHATGEGVAGERNNAGGCRIYIYNVRLLDLDAVLLAQVIKAP